MELISQVNFNNKNNQIESKNLSKDAKIENNWIRFAKQKYFRNRPNASERAQTHPNASERVQTGPNTSEKLEKLAKTSKKLHEFL